jgi:hypothetical protein
MPEAISDFSKLKKILAVEPGGYTKYDSPERVSGMW